jgi:collagen type III alpha
MFKRLDKNGDGKITRDEAPDRMAENFDKIDKNGDGAITPDELRPPGGGQGGPGGDRPSPEEMFKRLDKNGDGKITRDEAPDRMAQRFDQLDKNGDGALTPDELRRPGGAGPRGPRPDGE